MSSGLTDRSSSISAAIAAAAPRSLRRTIMPSQAPATPTLAVISASALRNSSSAATVGFVPRYAVHTCQMMPSTSCGVTGASAALVMWTQSDELETRHDLLQVAGHPGQLVG